MGRFVCLKPVPTSKSVQWPCVKVTVKKHFCILAISDFNYRKRLFERSNWNEAFQGYGPFRSIDLKELVSSVRCCASAH